MLRIFANTETRIIPSPAKAHNFPETAHRNIEAAGTDLQQMAQFVIDKSRDRIFATPGLTSFGRSVAAFVPELPSDVFVDAVRNYRRVLVLGSESEISVTAEAARPMGAGISGTMPIVSVEDGSFVTAAAALLRNRKPDIAYTERELPSNATNDEIKAVQKLQQAVHLTPLPGALLRGDYGPVSTVLMENAQGRLIGTATTLGLADVGKGFEQTSIMVGVAVAPGMQGRGLGTMLTASALLAAKSSLGARRVIAVVDPDNAAALKTNAQFGMVPASGLGALYVEFAADA